MEREGQEWETVLAWRTLCQLQEVLEDRDAVVRISIDSGAIQASAGFTFGPEASDVDLYEVATGTDLAVTLMALTSAVNARLVQVKNTTETEGR